MSSCETPGHIWKDDGEKWGFFESPLNDLFIIFEYDFGESTTI